MLSILVLLFWNIAAAESVQDVTALLDRSRKIELLNGNKIELRTPESPHESLEFVDLEPRANWAHPAVLRLKDKTGKILESHEVRFPPKGLEEDQWVGLSDDVPLSPTFRISDLKGKWKIKSPEKFYAVLINGYANRRHKNDFVFLHRVLTQVYGYRPENIFVADSVHKDKAPDLGGKGAKDIQHESTGKGLENLFQDLGKRLKSDDHLLLVLNDHGEREKNESTVLLFDGMMRSRDFAALVKPLPPRNILMVFEQCYGAGFIRPTVAEGRTGMAASSELEKSWTTPDARFDEFLYHLTTAFAGQTHEGKVVNADFNRDGKVSAREAYAFAVGNGKAAESPVLEAYPNSGDADGIGFGF